MMRIKTYLIMAGLCLFASSGIISQTQYIGPNGGDWFTLANWNNGLPGPGKDALIGGGINLVIGSPLTVSFTITNFGGITAQAAVTNNGTISNSGRFDFASSSGLTNNGTFNNFGTSTFTGPASFVNAAGASFTNVGTFTLSTLLTNRGAVANNGTINAAAGTLVTEGSFDNSQVLTTESLTVATGSTFTNNFGANLLITGAAALLQVNGNFNNLGNVESNGALNVNGNFSNSSLLLVRGTWTIATGAVFNNANGTVTNEGNAQNLGNFINGFRFNNSGTFVNGSTFTNNNLIDNLASGVFTNAAGASISMGFGSKIQNAGSFVNVGNVDSFGNLENRGSFTNTGNINSFSGSQINALAGSFANDGTISTNDQVNLAATFLNTGTINVNGGSVWKNSGNFTNTTSGFVNNLQDFQNLDLGVLINNGRFVNRVRTLNTGAFTNNAYISNTGIFTNETTGSLTNNELFQLLSGNLQNKGNLANTDFLQSDECSAITNTGSINNTGKLEVHAILFQRGTLSGTAVDCQGCYVHTGSTANAPTICQNGTFGANIDGDIKVYAPELIAFANFDSCSNFVYLANSIDRPVFTCSQIGTTINANIVLRIPNTTDSLTCTAIITPTDVLEPQASGCPKDVVVFTDQPNVDVEWTAPTFLDNCTPVTVTASHDPWDSFPVGITGVTYTAIDAYGNTGNCQFRVDVRQAPPGSTCTGDVTGPTFVGCPSNISLTTTGNGAKANWVAPTATDNCYPLFINSAFVPGQTFGIGTTAVVYTATDGNGNERICSFNVTVTSIDPCVVDNTPPSFLNCPANIYKPTNPATGGAVAVWAAPNVFDLCGGASVTASHVSGSVFATGTTTVTYSAQDANSNTASCSFTITVGNDPCPDISSPPVFSNCPANISIQTNGISATATWTAPTANGPCLPITINSNYAPGATFLIGQTGVVYRASDVKGNTSTCSFTVTVAGNCTVDNTPPVISNCPANITVPGSNGFGVATWTPPTANDNCGLVSFGAAFSPGASFPVGVTTVIYAAADASGNGATCQFNVSVVTAPNCTTNAAPIDLTTNVAPASVALSWNTALNASAYDVYLGTANPPASVVVANVAGTSTTVTNLQGGTAYYWYVVPKNAAGLASGCASSITRFTTTNAPVSSCNLTALFIASSTTLNTSDANAKARLEALGFTVTVVDDDLSTTAQATGKGLIFISATVNSGSVNTKYRDVAVPIICNESHVLDDLKMTGTAVNTNYGTQGSLSKLAIQNTTHPLAAGLSGTVTVFSSNNTVSWGVPSASAVAVAAIPGNTSRKAIFAYETGASMVGMNAPARRVGFFLEDANANLLTTQGANLFASAVKWAAGFQSPGAPCNDGNANTINDVILANGCTCQGTACAPVHMVCESYINNNGWVNHADCRVVVCEGDRLTLSVNPNGAQSSSMTGPNGYNATSSGGNDFFISNSINQSHAGNYQVSLIDANGCPGSTVITVIVNPKAPTAVCKNLTLQLQSVGQSVQFSGQDLNNGSLPGCNATITSLNASPTSYSQPGTYTATLTVTNSLGLSATCHSTVTVLAPACSNVTNGGTIAKTCQNGSVQLSSTQLPSGGSGTIEYLWISGTTNCDISTMTPVPGGSNSPSLSIGTVAQKTYFIRRSRRAGCTEWNGKSNCITVNPMECVQAGNCQGTIGSGLLREVWHSISGYELTNLTNLSSYPYNPSATFLNASSTGPSGYGENYGTRVRGYITPTVSGAYTFYVTGDDYTSLRLSTSNNPANATEIAGFQGWTNQNEFFKYPSQKSAVIQLQAGQHYFVELLHVEVGGGDHWGIHWVAPGGSSPVNIPVQHLSPYTVNCDVFVRTGKITIEQASATSWYTVNFSAPFAQAPSVILGPPSANSDEQVIPRIRNVSTTGFEFQLDEWDYLNGYHPKETLFYLAVAKGTHTIGNIKIESGTFTANHNWATKSFNQAFPSAPVVLTTVSSYNDGNAVAPRQRSIGTGSFQFKLQEEDLSSHSNETINYIAISTGTFTHGGASFKAGVTSNSVTHNWYKVGFGATFNDPGFLASFHSHNNDDVSALRHCNLNSKEVKIKVEEEQWLDSEVSHPTEVVGWLVFSASTSQNVAAPALEELQLEAVKEEEHAVIYWTHNQGEKIADYILEKSTDGVDFEPIATMPSEGTNSQVVYENYDLAPVVGDNLYRVKMVHLDGTISYSAIASVHYDDLVDFSLFPNPADDFVKLNLEAVVGLKNITLTIHNNLGVAVNRVEIPEVYSKYHQLDLRNLKEGHYIVWLNMPGRKPLARQLVIAKK